MAYDQTILYDNERAALAEIRAKHPTGIIIVALRHGDDSNDFSDRIGFMREDGTGAFWPGTADPGFAPRRGKSRIGAHPDGVARIRVGFYEDVYDFGHHKRDFRHPALIQTGPVAFERLQSGVWVEQRPGVRGFNVHRAGWTGTTAVVDDWSHGCLVFADRLDHWHFLLAVGYPEHGRAQEEPPGGSFALWVVQRGSVEDGG